MHHAPEISIIINNYNYGRFLPAAIDSALQQSYAAVEVIVVDDGSTDHSRLVMEGYGAQIQAIFKPNGGQASALNTGFAQSRGDIVIFLDADDRLQPTTAQRVSEIFQADPTVAKVQYRMAIIDATGTLTGQIKPMPHLPLPDGDLRRQVLTFPFDLTWMATSGNAFAARVLRQILPIPEAEYRILADYYLAHLTPLFGSVVFLDEIGAQYRVHGANNYEQATTLDLEQIRRTILYARRTHRHIQKFAGQLGLTHAERNADELSVSQTANRLVSLKFDRVKHPVAGDTIWRLLRLGVRASMRRFDVALPMRLLFLGWFGVMAIAPKVGAAWLADRFFFPEKRTQLNKLLRIFHDR